MPRGEFLKPEELEYIRQNCLTLTDKQMSKHLKRDERTIKAARKRLGVNKGAGGKVETPKENNGKVIFANQRLTEEQRAEFFKTELSNSKFYGLLKEQFTPAEIDFYLEEWGSLCVQFEDIVATERRQIDELIKTEIMANRIRRNIKVAEDEILLLQDEVDQLRATRDMDNDESAQERDIQLINLIRTMGAQSNAMSIDLQKNIELRNKILSELNARRRDRIDQIKKSGTTFMGLIASFREREIREQQGKHMELVRLAKEKKKKEWRQPSVFPDRSKDCVLLDEDSELPEVDIVRSSETESKIAKEFSELSNKRILIVDNDLFRVQFFQEIFKNNTIDIASSYDKAVALLNNGEYDLVCLDYDLGLDKKGTKVAEYMLSNDLKRQSKVIVQSMNKEGSQQISTLLAGVYDLEVCPFDFIYKNFGEKNA